MTYLTPLNPHGRIRIAQIGVERFVENPDKGRRADFNATAMVKKRRAFDTSFFF